VALGACGTGMETEPPGAGAAACAARAWRSGSRAGLVAPSKPTGLLETSRGEAGAFGRTRPLRSPARCATRGSREIRGSGGG